MDQIIIKDLEVYANHGLYKEEKVLGQKFLVSAVLYVDTKLAGVSDQMEFSVDYGKVCHVIKDILTENDFNLIECVAETVAKKLLLKFPLVRKLEIEVKKPWAPIGLPLDYVSVKIKRGWHRAYIGVGSNMGDRMEYINQAIDAIEAQDDTKVVHVSSLIETKPYGGVKQDDFLNFRLCFRREAFEQRVKFHGVAVLAVDKRYRFMALCKEAFNVLLRVQIFFTDLRLV